MKTSWIFGDSFSQSMINENQNYIDICRNNGIKYQPGWDIKLSKHLGTKVINTSIGGNSPQGILDDFISNMNKFRKGDYVFISSSPTVRTVGYDDNNHKIQTWNLEMMRHNIDDAQNTTKYLYGTPNIVLKNKNLILDYVLTFLAPYEEEWQLYFEGKIKEFIELFRKQDIRVFYWTHKLWDNFSTVEHDTKGIIIDDHWGVTGQHDFIEYMKKRIDNNIYFSNEVGPPKNKRII